MYVKCCRAMEVVVAENRHFSSQLCSDDSDEDLSKPCGVAPCGILVHQRRDIVSTDAGNVEEHVAVEAVTAASELSASSEEVTGAMSCTRADVIGNCMAEASQSTSTNDCSLTVADLTAKLAKSDTGLADPATEPQCTVRPKSLCTAKKSVCFPLIDDTHSSTAQSADDGRCAEKQESKRMSLLLRLFESKLFDMSIALPYLFNSKEPGVLAYLGQCCRILLMNL